MEGWILLLMIGMFTAGVFALRLPTGIALTLAAVAGMISIADWNVARHIAEGSILYLDPVLIVFASVLFMNVFEQSGALGSLNAALIRTFGKSPAMLLIVLTLFVMFPGMFTGLTAPCVLTSGAMVTPVLFRHGLSPARAGAFIATAAFFGMVAPPVNICAMLIGGGVDMPYIGFDIPLALATFPLAFLSSFIIAGKAFRMPVAADAASGTASEETKSRWLYLPLYVLVLLMLGGKYFPNVIPNFGVPMIFVLATALAFVTGRRVKFTRAMHVSFEQALSVMALLVGIGIFIQVLTLTGARGWIVIQTLELPAWAQYLGMAVLVPLFGGISAYGSSVVLGVPLLLAMLGQNNILVATGLSMLASVGDFLPPTRLAVVLAGPVVGESNAVRIFKYCAVPAILAILLSVAIIYFANPLGKLLGLS